MHTVTTVRIHMQCVNINTVHTCVSSVHIRFSAFAEHSALHRITCLHVCMRGNPHRMNIFKHVARKKNGRIHVNVNFSYGAPTYTRNTSEQQS